MGGRPASAASADLTTEHPVVGVPTSASAVPPPASRATPRPRQQARPVRRAFWLLSTRGLALLLVALVLLGAGLHWRYSTLIGVAAALGLALLLDLVAVAWPFRIRVRREVTPPVVERHGLCTARLTVTGRTPGLARTTLTDSVGPSHGPDERRQELQVDLDAGELDYRVPTPRRGLLQVGPLTMHRVGVFGLTLTSRPQGEVDHVRVLPRSIPIREMARGRRRSAVGADESVEHGGTDLVGLHEYVPGDDLRRLHWATSARTGILMVRDDADPSTPHLTVVLDDTGPHYSDHGQAETDFEDAVEVAFALCRAAIQHNHPVHLVTLSGAVDVAVSERIGAAEVDAQRVYAALAEVQPGGDPSEDPTRGMRLPARALDSVAVVSGAEARVDVLASIAARGATGVVLVLDNSGGEQISTAAGAGGVRVLRAPRSLDLARLWDRVVG
ncbi:DUF58 domain-containing protein [Naumannella sp. ID2617S]|nr:DUF58 domain-containing protein [Naumannella sp. ID2617S]